jgi:hypothetical protein
LNTGREFMSSKNITFVIPTNRERVYTWGSIPIGCPVYVEREGSDYQARNR